MADPVPNIGYVNSPFQDQITANKDQVWVNYELTQRYLRDSVYSRFCQVRMTDAPTLAPFIEFQDLIPPRPNIDQSDPYALAFPRSTISSTRKRISFASYNGKLTFHKTDNLHNAWKLNGVAGWRAIINAAMGQMIIDQYDLLARNAMLQSPMKSFGVNKSSFANLTTDDLLQKDNLDGIWLHLQERERVWQNLHVNTSPENIFCITSPGGIYDLRKNLRTLTNVDYTPVDQYRNVAIKGEVFTHDNIRFVQSNLAVLRNAGPIAVRHEIKLPVAEQDGMPNPETTTVDGLNYVGQAGVPGQKYYIQLDDVTGLSVNDVVTIHDQVTSDFGVTDGVDWRANKSIERRIVAIDVPNRRIQVDKPAMIELATDLGGTVYGFVTKGRNVHTSTFIGGNMGVILAMARSLQLYTPPSIDDAEAIQRFTYDWFGKFNVFEMEDLHIHFHAGTNATYQAGTYVS